MAIEIIDCVQGEEDWFRARAGIPTASRFRDILAKGEGKTRSKYLRQLAGERITGEPMETFKNGHMERGNLMEDEARKMYAFTTGHKPERVGFVRNGSVGCSPDSLIDAEGGLEIKTALPDILIEALMRDDIPPEHKPQTQGVLWVSERKWIDLAIFWPKMPICIRRVERDEAYIDKLARDVAAFNDELELLVAHLQRF